MQSKSFVLFSLLVTSITSLHAQDYFISFSGSGASETVTSITVENLNQGTSKLLDGNKILHLVNEITITEPVNQDDNYKVGFAPNPMTEETIMYINLRKPGATSIFLFDVSGKRVLNSDFNLLEGNHRFRIQNVDAGLYLIVVKSGLDLFKGKLLCVASHKGNPQVIYDNARQIMQNHDIKKSGTEDVTQKGELDEVLMQYTSGDKLKITGTSGVFSTVLVDIPSQSKNIDFQFVPCLDSDGNSYPVVKIGTRIWMAENLKTTKYRNGDSIPQLKDVSQWNNIMKGAYCNYNNDANLAIKRGRLYNFYAINDSRKIAPQGWHVAVSADWASLISYLGGSSQAGGKLKETGTSAWKSPNNYATNQSGFTALPGGFMMNGFYHIDDMADWWTATNYDNSYAWHQFLYNDRSNIYGENNVWGLGLSVRCVLDQIDDFPVLTTTPISSVTGTTAVSGGKITYEGRSKVVARGVCWSTSEHPSINDSITVDGSGSGSFVSSISGLLPGTIYYFRAYATNNIGTSYGNEFRDTTDIIVPSLATKITSNTSTTAITHGTIINGGGAAITARGICWSLARNPTVLDFKTTEYTTSVSFTGNLTGLTPNTTYYLRAFATNIAGTGYGNEIVLKTYTGTVSDIDGNIYNTVTIGTQIWLAENLKTTRFNDGTQISLIESNEAWASLTIPGYCWRSNDISNKWALGALYNLYSAVNPKICPIGWHIPNPEEFPALINYLGGWDSAGVKLRSSGGWPLINPEEETYVFNSSGFTGLAGGYRTYNGTFYGEAFGSYWSYDYPYQYLYIYELYSTGFIERSMYYFNSNFGFSIRCIKN